MNFRLLETMRVLPGGEIVLLDRHIQRLSRSAHQLSFRFDVEVLRQAILERVMSVDQLSWLRLTLAEDGENTLAVGPLELRNPSQLKLASFRVNSADPFLYHKTTNREIYDRAKREGDADTDVLFVNERGEITEITIANIAVFRNGQWVTPQLSCGLLNGVMRSELLATGGIIEGVIRAEDLAPGETIRCFNALRGVFDTTLVAAKILG